MKNFIEITQDSAGVIEKNNETNEGFFTGDIQSCLITVYKCKNAHIIIHDSGQLKISEICKLIKKYGEVEQVTTSFGPNLNNKHNQTRLNKILLNINYNKNIDILECQADTFAFIFPINGKPITTMNIVPDYVNEIPDKERRTSIIKLNNFFLSPNSQKLGLDIQYENGKYQNPRGLDFTLEEMLNITERQPSFFFLNITLLAEAHNAGLVTTPAHLIDVAKKPKPPASTSTYLHMQETEFQKFIQQRHIRKKSK